MSDDGNFVYSGDDAAPAAAAAAVSPRPVVSPRFPDAPPSSMGMPSSAKNRNSRANLIAGMASPPSKGEPGRRMSSIRFKTMQETVLKEPPMYLTKRGEEGWATDLVGLVGNGVRREMQDMYYLVGSLQKRILDITSEDIEDFYEWYGVFDRFVRDSLDYLKDALFPACEAKFPLDTPNIDAARRKSARSGCIAAMNQIAECREQFQRNAPGEVLPKLIAAIDLFSPPLLAFFGDIEKTLSPLMMKCFSGGAESAALEKALFDFYRKTEQNHFNIRMIVRAVTGTAEKNKLYNSYVKIGGLFKAIKFRRSFEASKDRFRDEHTDILKESYKRWGEAKVAAEEEEHNLTKQYAINARR
eukprot:CAMPEP_0184709552 /NCGR_PEP_ID=MMETSP0314-20130426/666_1 /TAXON_ID=38298 /ORGANISM="Rhodella maculata, Strain CCMP 736" /LENGTH=356 /DNA_ID=CAMNT_0027171273 /DNA_START=21 /DNA_END=1091 /DNA_ORIENTATION=+